MVEQTVRELLEDQVELDIEGIDRIYLNGEREWKTGADFKQPPGQFWL